MLLAFVNRISWLCTGRSSDILSPPNVVTIHIVGAVTLSRIFYLLDRTTLYIRIGLVPYTGFQWLFYRSFIGYSISSEHFNLNIVLPQNATSILSQYTCTERDISHMAVNAQLSMRPSRLADSMSISTAIKLLKSGHKRVSINTFAQYSKLVFDYRLEYCLRF